MGSNRTLHLPLPNPRKCSCLTCWSDALRTSPDRRALLEGSVAVLPFLSADPDRPTCAAVVRSGRPTSSCSKDIRIRWCIFGASPWPGWKTPRMTVTCGVTEVT